MEKFIKARGKIKEDREDNADTLYKSTMEDMEPTFRSY